MTLYLTTIAIALTLAAERLEDHAPTDPHQALAVAWGIATQPADSHAMLRAISWVESRHDPHAVGDGGDACGAWQQTARTSPGVPDYWTSRGRRVPEEHCGLPLAHGPEEECARLVSDTRYAACTAWSRLVAWGSPEAYNAGPRGARLGRGRAYGDAVRGRL